jgi:hypothetical protein
MPKQSHQDAQLKRKIRAMVKSEIRWLRKSRFVTVFAEGG